MSERQDRNDEDLWLYDKDVNNAIKKFARTQKDSKYYNNLII